MGLFDLFKKSTDKKRATKVDSSTTIPESEKKYYQPDSYYTKKVYEGTMFEKEVITFERRKQTSIPSKNGLYVPEILMLHFCKKYPNPKRGYPGYWWFKYGIRDVGSAFKSLEERGFIILNDSTQKYRLTNLGELELKENEYVPYMHCHSTYTNFTIWDLNLMLGTGDKSNYMEVISKCNAEITKVEDIRNKEFMESLKRINPTMHKKLKEQDEQLSLIKEAEEKYKHNKNLDVLIDFWENIWVSEGLKFNSSRWIFRLPDLYIKTKQYERALNLVYKIKNSQEVYSNKADDYILKIENLKSK